MKPQIEIVQGDITTLRVDVIVNAANPSLMGGGGVDGAIHRAAGPQLLEACKVVRQQQGECPPGHAVITLAGDLNAKAVIHAVGPVWHGGDRNEASILEETYRNCLRLAADNGYNTMAFPAISTGVYGYPKAEAARIAVNTVYHYLSLKPVPEKVIFVCFDEETARLYEQMLIQREQELGIG
ncbi:O-acetyl-ADP-ribose deacetylase [Enterobacter cancerogenus]|jgi:O-acetyl-ADP-ribose deacetylase|uniref:O-acetyl-ADP-ribose deacetylase n=1 Tax=Enterobacter cancerogenus TaxID=69218 RepID=A0AB38P9L3_9ENTR|nr:O-acetyl-ADP-ribose deacetylase [Enterobacter cancerogenus]AUJ82118.1 O-acetyl-ADP-ribose deacetylase [Enterobacter cancerogenus]EFC57085.1 macro domain protein [Enterobacter cancerogenus ATCC 35316]KTQ49652.1 RNase III inhibitor [Enterobacter cancerogenus]KTQ51684.1 RNase III inhibitor [Enterobacter cancerogenus]KTQ73158.1 RNase III inhibitor [Enterobacter cancerogenus]